MRVICLLLVVLAVPSQAATLKFDYVSGLVSYDTVDWVEGYPDEPSGAHRVSFTFEVPELDLSDFEYASVYDGEALGVGSIDKNDQNAILLSHDYNNHYNSFGTGEFYASIRRGVVTINYDFYDEGDHFVYYSSNGIYVDHNQGDIFEWSSGYWLALLDDVVVGSSEPGFVLPPDGLTPSAVPLPASLPLLLAGCAALFGLRRRAT